jgi:hypothetical protein
MLRIDDDGRAFELDPLSASARATDPDPDHHLWRNGRVWWIAFTFHTDCGRKYRVRKSLATKRVVEARTRRDALLARYAAQPKWRLSLRYERRDRHSGSRLKRTSSTPQRLGSLSAGVLPLAGFSPLSSTAKNFTSSSHAAPALTRSYRLPDGFANPCAAS